ncbi:MAG: metal-dependent hydrolase [Gammaproteobacteria bacterium]|nr:metal-dependent hydrolase [Gammaproteobacteria bacterium]
MDTLTHALSGALLARASRRPQVDNSQGLTLRVRMMAGFLASAFPDIDFIFWFFGDLTYLNNHRGMTHSVILLPVWALMLAMAFAGLSRGCYQWQQFYWVSALGLGIHILGDIITAYGTMIFAPFSMMKLAFPTTFILDPWFSGIILLALFMAWINKQHSQRIAVAGLTILLGYIGYQAVMQQKAIDIAETYRVQQGWQGAKIHVLPQFLLPHHWKLVITHGDQYHVSYVNVMKQTGLAESERESNSFISMVREYFKPADRLNWLTHDRYGKQKDKQDMAKQIWQLEKFSDIRTFMMFPAFDRIEQRSEGTCGVFIDHRFVIDNVRTPPFQFGACQTQGRPWQLYRFKSGRLIRLD